MSGRFGAHSLPPTRLIVRLGRVFCVCTMGVLGSGLSNSWADDYLEIREPRRLALVVANDEYKFLGQLPGVKADLTEMKEAFHTLGFDVVVTHENVRTWDEFQYEVLKPFRAKVERDDLVVVYFSGHGFTYGGYQYFAPSDMPKQLVEGKVATTAIPVETLASVFQTEGAGGVVLIVDACRTIADFVIKTKDGQEVPKGGNDGEVKASNINYVLALSVNAGLPSQASLDPTKMSAYSKALFDRLDEEKEFRTLHDDVEFAVSQTTNDKQVPVLYDHTWTDMLLLKSVRWASLERERWQSVLSESSREGVENFAKRYTLSPYVRAARRWLKDHRDEEQAALVPVSPLGVELAWQTQSKVRGLAAGFQFPQEVLKGISSVTDLDKLGVLVGEGSATPNKSQLDQFAEYVASQRQVFVEGPGSIHASPDLASTTVAGMKDLLVRPVQEVLSEKPKEIEFFATANDYSFGTYCQGALTGIFTDLCAKLPDLNPRSIPLTIPDPDFKPRNWVKVYTDKSIGWIPIDSDTSSFSIDVGKPFEEITMARRPNAPSGLADLAPLQDALLRLGDNKLSWASIASPLAVEGSKQADLADLMRVNIEHALRATGLATDRVTVVSQDPTVTPGTLRLRLFTTRKD